MALKGKPAALERGGPSERVRLKAEHPNTSANPATRQGNGPRRLARPRIQFGVSKAQRVWRTLKSLGSGTLSDIEKALVAADFEYEPGDIRGRVNSLFRRKLVVKVSGPGTRLEETVWTINPDADLQVGPDVRQELRLTLKGATVRLGMHRPRLSDGEMRPCLEALRFHVGALPDLIVELRAVEVAARDRGLIGPGK